MNSSLFAFEAISRPGRREWVAIAIFAALTVLLLPVVLYGGTFASRHLIRPRASFSRKTIVSCRSKPIKCKVFLPVSMPIVLTATTSISLDIGGMLFLFHSPIVNR